MSKLVSFSAATYFFSMFVWLLLSLAVIAVIGIPVDTDIECHIDNDLLYTSYIEAFGFSVMLIVTMVICFRYFFLPTTVIGRVQFGALIYAMHFMIFGWLLSDCQIEFLDEILNLLILILPPVIVGKYFDKYVGGKNER